MKRFQSTANYKPRHRPGRVEKLDENVAVVRNYFDQKKEASVRMASKDLQLSYRTVLKILKSQLCWIPYSSFRAPELTPTHIDQRLSAYDFWVNFSDKWFDRIIWTDEKMFVPTQTPY